MKKIICILFGSLLFMGWYGCNKKKGNSIIDAESDYIDIAFIKQGELSFFSEDRKEIKKIDIEIADTFETTTQGLMYRSHMDENQGMLFIFEESKVIKTFFMKNTRISLDIIYVDDKLNIINIIKRATPFSEDLLPPSLTPCRYVVEIKGGLSDAWGLKKGDKIKWQKTLLID